MLFFGGFLVSFFIQVHQTAAQECVGSVPPGHGGWSFVLDQQGTTNGSFQVIICAEGYTPVGQIYSRCDGSGGWEQVLTCEVITCQDPGSLQNGTVSASDLNFGSSYDVTCMIGYELIGSASRTCVGQGFWNGTAPYCREIDDCENVNCTNGVCLDLIDSFECVCETGFTGTYCDTRVLCDASHPIVVRAEHALLSDSPNSFGSTYNTTCDDGFDLIGPSMITCQSDGSWSGGTARCLAPGIGLATPCEKPSDPDNGTYIFAQENGNFATFLYLACEDGFRPNEAAFERCHQFFGIFIRTLRCERIFCQAPEVITNAQLSYSELAFGSTYNVTCNQDYVLIGSPIRTCVGDGVWDSEQPYCKEIDDCENVNCTNGVCLDLIDSFECVCETGFTGTYCDTRVLCDASHPIVVRAEHALLSDSPNSFGSTYNTTCDDGFDLIGPSMITCQSDGSWSGGTARCLAPGIGLATPCEKPSDPDNGTYIFAQENGNFATFLYLACEDGFRPNEAAFERCHQFFGVFIRKLRCERIFCQAPEVITNAQLSYSELAFGSTYNVTCNQDYVLIGSPIRTCVGDGVWDSEQPYCKEIDHCENVTCGDGVCLNSSDGFECICDPGFVGASCETRVSCPVPDEVQNGTLSRPTDTVYGTVYNTTCASGYELVGSDSRTCRSDGTWSGGEPICLDANDCQNVTCVHGVCQDLPGGFNCFCQAGYTGLYCDTKVPCPEPDDVANGTVTLPGEFVYGAVYSVSCQPGFDRMGSANRRCQSDGTWSGSHPVCLETNDCENVTCVHGVCQDLFQSFSCFCEAGFTGIYCDARISCDPPHDVENATLSLPASNLYGSVYSITCKPGFSLVGPANRTCQSDGSWSGSSPVCMDADDCENDSCAHGVCHDLFNGFTCFCEQGFTGTYCEETIAGASCPQPDDVEKGTVGLLSDTAHGSVYTILCDAGYQLKGPASRTCQSGMWSGTEPFCLEINDCVDVTCSHGVCLDLIQNFTCVCEAGYFGRYCEIKIPCPAPDLVQNASISLPQENVYGSVYNVTCKQGYQLTGSASRICQCDGTWSGDNAVCLDIDDCAHVKCLHGHCNDLVDGFECACIEGYTGTLCEDDINECLDNNGGCEQLCFNLKGTHFCYCKDGYSVDDDDASKCRGNFSVQLRISYNAEYDEALADRTSTAFNDTIRNFREVFVEQLRGLLEEEGLVVDDMNIHKTSQNQSRGSLLVDMGLKFTTWITISQRSVIASFLSNVAMTTPVNISGTNYTASSTPLVLPIFPESGTELEVTSVCSLYDESQVCGEGGRCTERDNRPVCVCPDGSTAGDCRHVDNKGNGDGGAETPLLVLIGLLLVITFALFLIILLLISRKNSTDTSSRTFERRYTLSRQLPSRLFRSPLASYYKW